MPFLFYLGVFLVSAAMLMLQIIETRILSVIGWYYVAFLIVGLAMLGLTAGAVRVYVRRRRYRSDSLFTELAAASNAFALTMTASMLLQMVVPFVGWRLPGVNFVVWVLASLLIAVPFYCAGIVVSLALTRSPFPVSRVYAVDLVGAAVGCLAVLALINIVDAPSAILWTGVLTALASLAFAGAGAKRAPAPAGPAGPLLFRRRHAVVAVLFVVAAANGAAGGLIRPLYVKGQLELGANAPVFEEWNSYSRVTVLRERHEPAMLWGPAPTFEPERWRIDQRIHQIDAVALTPAYRLEGELGRAQFLEYDVTSLVYALPGVERVAVIGIGAGRDIIAAKYFGAASVTGIEINPILVRLLRDEPGFADYVGLGRLDGIEMIVDEARNWFARTGRAYDVIQMSMIDTWAATGAGAFSLSEHGLYTQEAWLTLLARLTPGGVLTVSRHFSPSAVVETGRMVSLAMATGIRAGFAEPSRHIFLAASGTVATLIFSRSPLGAERVAGLQRMAERFQHVVLIAPGTAPPSPVLRQMVAAESLEDLARISEASLLDLSPPSDDRPFFFNQLPFSTALGFLGRALRGRPADYEIGAVSGNLQATKTLILLLVIAAFYSASAILVPLRPTQRDMSARLALAGTSYFALIGFGFMMVEIGLLQKFSVYLGHPVYGLSVVLFSIILSTGLGSALSGRLVLKTPLHFSLWTACTAGYLMLLALASQRLLIANDAAVLVLRCALTVALIAPAGLLMGFGFPAGMQLVMSINPGPAPWFWGMNGAAGVIASIVAVIVSIAYGIGTTLLVGAVCYLLLLPAALALGFGPARAAAVSPNA